MLALGGCAVSGSLDQDEVQTGNTVVDRGTLPELVEPAEMNQPSDAFVPAVAAASTEKFSHSDQQQLNVQELADGSADGEAGMQHAYAGDASDPLKIVTQKASLKPFVGRWTLKANDTREKMQVIGSYLGLADTCEIVLEGDNASSGNKAKGNSACPTSLFMLDSWVAFDKRLVLRDHMGDEIVQLKSRGTDMLIGVSKDGRTLVLNKS